MKTVIVGMSGGVDSSYCAYLLKEQGYRVIGLFMKNWEEEDRDGNCQASKEYEDVAAVCELIGIPYYTINLSKEYWDRVFSTFLEDLKKGLTPNPDILCNREIKFGVFYQKALEMGADFVATGHYARTDGEGNLLRAADPDKDQTYFLYTLKKDILKKVLFPIGHLKKSEVRALAKQAGLPTAEKKDSTGICFIGKRNFRPFVQNYLPYQKGPLLTLDGKEVGTHEGAAFYTIGQRKGLGIGGPGEAWFVCGKDIEKNIVYVVQGENHPALFSPTLQMSDVTWIDAPAPKRCTAKIRYRQQDQACTLENENVLFDRPQRAITPQQSVVFYDGEKCLGGAIISPSQ